MLAVGERGHQPAVTVWNLATGAVLRELVGGHRFGVGCITFSPCGSMVATMGFKHDRMLRVRGFVELSPSLEFYLSLEFPPYLEFPLIWNLPFFGIFYGFSSVQDPCMVKFRGV